MKKTRLKDIAKITAVSETAVSLVLNGRKNRISKEKQDEIRRVAQELNYHPNQIARSLVQKRTFTIGLIIPDITNPFFSSLSKHIEEYLYQEGYLLLIANSHNTTERERRLIQSYLDRQVDGILLCPSDDILKEEKDYGSYLEKLAIPLVIIDRIIERAKLLQIAYDDEMGGFLATQYLIEQGCKKIACVTGPLSSQSSKRRVAGYQQALCKYQLTPSETLVHEGNFSFQSGVTIAPKLLGTSIDGIFFSNDLMAYGFFYYLKKQAIPQEDYVICGYDNLQLSEMFHLSLPSIEQNTKKLSEKTCQAILESIHHTYIPKIELLTPRLITPS